MNLGDANTKYYHACASIRQNRNLITSIDDASDNIIIRPKLIEECITNAFRKRFASNSECSFNSEYDLSLLDCIVSDNDNVKLCVEVKKLRRKLKMRFLI